MVMRRRRQTSVRGRQRVAPGTARRKPATRARVTTGTTGGQLSKRGLSARATSPARKAAPKRAAPGAARPSPRPRRPSPGRKSTMPGPGRPGPKSTMPGARRPKRAAPGTARPSRPRPAARKPALARRVQPSLRLMGKTTPARLRGQRRSGVRR